MLYLRSLKVGSYSTSDDLSCSYTQVVHYRINPYLVIADGVKYFIDLIGIVDWDINRMRSPQTIHGKRSVHVVYCKLFKL